MRNSVFRVGRFLAVMTTLLALIGMATSAQAASFRRGWDPLFNAVFSPTLGWRGEAVIFVSDGCLSSGATVNFDAGGVAGCGSANIESYSLEFYDVGNPLVNLDSFSDNTPGNPLFPAIQNIRFDTDSIADGVDLWGEIEVNGLFNFGGFGYTAFMSFGLDTTSLRLRQNCEDNECPSFFNDVNLNPTVEWSRVPTPAPLALLSIGLFALTMIRRRKA